MMNEMDVTRNLELEKMIVQRTSELKLLNRMRSLKLKKMQSMFLLQEVGVAGTSRAAAAASLAVEQKSGLQA